MRDIVLIAHNLRSTHNVGSLLRTAEGLGVSQVYLTGYSPYPLGPSDSRLPHLAQKTDRQIAKTALGAERLVTWHHETNITLTVNKLRAAGYTVVAVEQTAASAKLPSFQAPDKVAILVGREVEGVESDVLALCDSAVEIPMLGNKESFNVVQAAAMALYHCRFIA